MEDMRESTCSEQRMPGEMPFAIRPWTKADLPAVMDIWNASVLAGEVVFAPMTEAYFERKFLLSPNADPRFYFVAETDGQVSGFVLGMQKKRFLNGENPENTPGYLCAVFVRKDERGQGIGKALVAALEQAFLAEGKEKMACGGTGPVDLDWRIPGTPGHDHNNAPGVDEDCAGYPFLTRLGYQTAVREVALYLNLAAYRPWPGLAAKQAELAKEGIFIGPYDPGLGYDYDGMCDRVKSEYWREALRTEITAHLTGKANADPRFWPDDRQPAGPRPIMAAICKQGRAIVAQAGPVDVQKSGRGWFTGICTDPLYERKGIATVLFNALMQQFIEKGAAFSTIFTGTENHARRVYERTGFRPVRTFALMRKSLTKAE